MHVLFNCKFPVQRKLSVSHCSRSAAFETDTEALASPVLLVRIPVCSGDDKHPNDDVEGGASQRNLMHFNDIPGKPQLRELWEGSDGGIPALWQLISFHISINNNSTCNN